MTVFPRTLALLSLVLAIGLTGAASPAQGAKRYRPCTADYGPRGEPHQGFWRNLRVKRTTCRTGRRVVVAYLKTGAGVGPDGSRTGIHGYRCRIRLQGETGHLLCTRRGGRHAIRMTGHP
jgi:hypothetical protein